MAPDVLTREEKDLIEGVLQKVLASIDLGFDLAGLNVLDNVNASKRTIQELGTKIAVNNTELSTAILEIAHSVYFGHHVECIQFFILTAVRRIALRPPDAVLIF